MYTRIVVPLDGSEIAESALEHAAYLANITGATIHLVRVVDDIAQAGFGMYAGVAAAATATYEDETEETRAYLNTVAARLTADGVRTRTEVLHGAVTAGITGCTQPGDLVVMASHGRTGLARWFLGSIAEEVVRRSSVPVLLVRSAPSALHSS